jgi:hypothetical protein
MTYEEKLAFVKEHLGEEIEFRKEVGGHCDLILEFFHASAMMYEFYMLVVIMDG